MTPAEREHAVAYLERTKSALLDAAAPLSESQWRFKPGPDQWSAAECIEHLVLVEERIFASIQKVVAGPPAGAEVLRSCAGKESTIQRAVPVRGTKVTAPEPVRPSAGSGNPAAAVARFSATRDRTLEYARATTDPIRQRTFPHIVFGQIDCYQWLIFVSAHTERHLAQLLEATEAEGRARQTASGL